MQTQGDLLNQQKLLRSTEQRRRHPTTRARSDCVVAVLLVRLLLPRAALVLSR